jgi:nitroimidazol reductase NimA-like FMN-containing flavoprotein (pyridoxamine 5'-phosphate oxidase superfamily)
MLSAGRRIAATYVDDVAMKIEELGEEECVDLLAKHHFGRIGVVVASRPVILPVNYVFENGRIAIRTDPGTKLSAAAQGQVAFEVDAIDESSRSGWSVLVTGVGYDVTDALDRASEEVRAFPVDTWVPGDRACWIRIEPDAITGRRVRPA